MDWRSKPINIYQKGTVLPVPFITNVWCLENVRYSEIMGLIDNKGLNL